ncbi:hypothetical protein N7478_008087 [Penicillium angulare]|uniref:uncharacterized protein n=1 Tax=Penicillium angulare TaxID=116970 RepID=UPI0025422C3F|nr:uncharacterized protein N7478_008087 [Penicillium angulare]KAJ5272962.1 hypothetical protein N7478_008087 [Penicillium angulare]
MKAWLYTTTSPSLEKSLTLHNNALAPPTPKNNELLIQVLSASLNHTDYQYPEQFLNSGLARLIIGTPASPGIEFCGRVTATGPLAQHLKEGTIVYGCHSRPTQFGTLAEYLVIKADKIAILPDGVDINSASAVSICGITAYQALEGNVKPGSGSSVLINGGSGGCGQFAIQIAKAMGCRVTATCSTRNMELCLRIGADEVIDYTAEEDLVRKLASRGSGMEFDCIIDNVGTPSTLYYECHRFLKEEGVFMQVGVESVRTYLRAVWPAFLGGGRRRYVILRRVDDNRRLVKLGEWLGDRTVQVQTDGVYEFHDVVKAFEKLRSGHARGKIVVRVSDPHARDMQSFGIGF